MEEKCRNCGWLKLHHVDGARFDGDNRRIGTKPQTLRQCMEENGHFVSEVAKATRSTVSIFSTHVLKLSFIFK